MRGQAAAPGGSASLDFRSVESNLRHSFRVLASHRPSGELRELDGVTIASAGVVFQMFNAAFLASPVESDGELEKRIAAAATHFAIRQQEWAYWICEDWLALKVRRRARQVFRNHGLHVSAELPGMVAERLRLPERGCPALEIRRVADGPTQDAFCAVGSTCFNVPPPWFREVFENRAVWRDFAGYVGYADGEPVTTAATVAGAGVIGLYNVATLPPHQRRGYGEAVTRHALARAGEEHGIWRSVLQATPQGLRLYERMGFRSVTTVTVYC